ncbi:MAG: hypothetical protein SFV18_08645 [Bryobacteraceae bacterium]|nr:hypothetical protein [Bryobacteraceae bacterium]
MPFAVRRQAAWGLQTVRYLLVTRSGLHIIKALQVAAPTSGRSQVDRILHSETFRHADQLRHLLDYLAERSLAGDGGTLKEYTVGIEALGKRTDYDPRKDAAVRIQAGRLRTKLDEYYRNEGADDRVLVAMPKGGFRVEFSERAAEPVSPPPAPTGHWRWAAGGALAALALVLVCGLLWIALRGRPPLDPALSKLWGPFLTGASPVLSMGPHLFWQSGELVFRDWNVNRVEQAPDSKAFAAIRPALPESPRLAPIYVGYGETEGALAIARFLAASGRSLEFRRAGQLSWEDIKTRGVILIGSPKTVAHIKDLDRLEDRLAFLVGENGIANRAPKTGEPSHWRPVRAGGELLETAVVVTRLSGGDGQGALFLIGSPDGEGALAGCQAVTSASLAKQIAERVGDTRDFQVVLRAPVKNQTPLKTTIVAFRKL